MYIFTTSLLCLLALYIMLLMSLFPNPLPVALDLFIFVIICTLWSNLTISDFLPYMLYLVYIGGLLVLVIYLVLLATNQLLPSISIMLMAFLFMMCLALTGLLYFLPDFNSSLVGDKLLTSGGDHPLNWTALVLVAVLLLYMFLYICASIRLGGRAVDIEKTSY